MDFMDFFFGAAIAMILLDTRRHDQYQNITFTDYDDEVQDDDDNDRDDDHDREVLGSETLKVQYDDESDADHGRERSSSKSKEEAYEDYIRQRREADDQWVLAAMAYWIYTGDKSYTDFIAEHPDDKKDLDLYLKANLANHGHKIIPGFND